MGELPQYELECRLLYSCIVAGKSAKFADSVMHRFLTMCCIDRTPFETLRAVNKGQLDAIVRQLRTGNYSKLIQCFWELGRANLDLRTCTPEQLETIHGIGPKTSRFFILWTRPGAEYAALDVHVLRWLRSLGHNAPRSTPSGSKYAELEKVFLDECRARGKKPRELDAEIWAAGSKYQEAA